MPFQWRTILTFLAAVPFTLVFLCVQVGANWAAGTFSGVLPPVMLRTYGISHFALGQGDLLTLVTSIFLSHNIPMFVHQLVLVVCFVGLFEYRFGTLRAIVTFFTIDLAATAGVVLLIAGPLGHLPIFADADPALAYDVGMSAGGFAMMGALAASLPRRWLWLALAIAGLAAKIWLEFDPIADLVHPLTFTVGFALYLVWRPERRRIWLPQTARAHSAKDTGTHPLDDNLPRTAPCRPIQ